MRIHIKKFVLNHKNLMHSYSIIFEEPVDYLKALNYQHRLLKARQNDEIPDITLLLQHNPVVTIGNRGRSNYLLKDLDEYKNLGIDVYQVERGGDVTYHGPGQWVLYPIIKLGRKNVDSHGYLFNLEEIAIRVLKDFGVDGFRRENKSGAWTKNGKIAAIGFRLKKWVTFHGMSFNVLDNLSGFKTIVPCGLEGESVTSLEKIIGFNCDLMNSVRDQILLHFSNVCDRTLQNIFINHEIPDFVKKYKPPL